MLECAKALSKCPGRGSLRRVSLSRSSFLRSLRRRQGATPVWEFLRHYTTSLNDVGVPDGPIKKPQATRPKKRTAKPVPTRSLLGDLRQLIEAAREQTARTVNSTLVTMYWQIGKRIRADVLQNERAEYGKEIVQTLSEKLTEEYGNGFTRSSLSRMMSFAEGFPDERIVAALSQQLSWSHFVELIPLEDSLKRDFYAELCRVERWSTRTLRHKIGHLLYERTAVSRTPEALIAKDIATLRNEDRLTPDMVFRDPYFLDLLFYHRRLRCLVAIDLKLGKFQASDKGQMELYLRWLQKHDMQPGEEPPLGLILCADKSDEHVELLRLNDSGIRVAQYLTELPPKKLLEKKLHDSIRLARERLARDENYRRNIADSETLDH